MKKILMGTAIILSFILLISALEWIKKPLQANTTQSTIESIYTSLNPKNPGRGLSDYESNQPVDIPKSYGMVLVAELIRKQKGIMPNRPSLHKVAGDWLLKNSKLSPDGREGWGVPVAWDAFGDGSINPENTIYTISNAIVMNALLDWLEKSPSDAPKAQIHQTLDAMIQPYLDSSIRTPTGLLPYSLMEVDRRYDTFNPAAYFAGQLQRYSLLVDAKYSKKLREIADQTMQSLLLHHQVDNRGKWFWYYSLQEATPNDLPHASYIALGIREYRRYDGKLGKQFDWPSIRDHFASFDRHGDTLFAWPDFSSNIDRPARLYDVGIALHFVNNEPELRFLRDRLLGSVHKYRNTAGNYQKYPIDSKQETNMGDRIVNEYVAYLYLGLLSCASSSKLS